MENNRIGQPLYYSSVLIKSPFCRRYYTEVAKVGLSCFESKRLIEVFEDWAYLLYSAPNINRDIKALLLSGIIKRRNFKYWDTKEGEEGSVILRFFNGLINFTAGDDNALQVLEDCVVIDRDKDCYNFKW